MVLHISKDLSHDLALGVTLELLFNNLPCGVDGAWDGEPRQLVHRTLQTTDTKKDTTAMINMAPKQIPAAVTESWVSFI